jgi:hypothetical protein
MRKIFWLSLLLGSACGPPSQAQARDTATARTCDWYNRCGEIAQGKTYANRDQCETENRKFWNDQWPISECDGKINPDSFDLCLKAIEITDCKNGLDLMNTVFNKCSRSSVCSGR